MPTITDQKYTLKIKKKTYFLPQANQYMIKSLTKIQERILNIFTLNVRKTSNLALPWCHKDDADGSDTFRILDIKWKKIMSQSQKKERHCTLTLLLRMNIMLPSLGAPVALVPVSYNSDYAGLFNRVFRDKK